MAMVELNKLERTHSGSLGEVECFSSRLTESIGSDSVRSFAIKADLSQTAIQKYLIGDSTPNVERLYAIAKAAGVTVEWLVTGNGPKYQQDFDALIRQSTTPPSGAPTNAPTNYTDFESEFALIPGYNIQVSAGWGSEADDESQPTRHLAFRRRWLKWRGFTEKDLTLVFAKGDSMEPTISDNNTLLVNMQRTVPTDGNIFVIRNGSQLWVKRVQVRPNAWLLISDNALYPPIEVPMDEQHNFQVIGQVVHIAKDI